MSAPPPSSSSLPEADKSTAGEKRKNPSSSSPPEQQEVRKVAKKSGPEFREHGDRRFYVSRPHDGLLSNRNIAQCLLLGIPVKDGEDDAAYRKLLSRLQTKSTLDMNDTVELRERYTIRCPLYSGDDDSVDDADYGTLSVDEVRARAMMPTIEGMVSLRYTNKDNAELFDKIVARASFTIKPKDGPAKVEPLAKLCAAGKSLVDLIVTSFSREQHVDVDEKTGDFHALLNFAMYDVEVSKLVEERVKKFSEQLAVYAGVTK